MRLRLRINKSWFCLPFKEFLMSGVILKTLFGIRWQRWYLHPSSVSPAGFESSFVKKLWMGLVVVPACVHISYTPICRTWMRFTFFDTFRRTWATLGVSSSPPPFTLAFFRGRPFPPFPFSTIFSFPFRPLCLPVDNFAGKESAICDQVR
jgi:hypothetical protein